MMEAFSEITLHISLAALGVLLAVLFAVKVAAPMWREIRRFASLPRIQQIVLGACIIGLVQYGATKSKFHFDGGIANSSTNPSVSTNSTLSIRWERDTSQGIYVPEAAAVYIDYRLSTDTNGVWQALGETTVGQWHYSAILSNATNYDYKVWAYYIPPEPVHTNGVWIYKTLKDRAGANPLPLRARIEINGTAIATPAEKRKDEGND